MSDSMEVMESASSSAQIEAGSLLSQIMEETRLQPDDESYDIALRGVEAFIVDCR